METDMDEIRKKVKGFLELSERAEEGIKKWEDENKKLKRENEELRKELTKLKGIEKHK